MKVERDPGKGFPYDPDFDYRAFQVREDVDGTLLGTHDASRELRLRSSQAVLDMVQSCPPRSGAPTGRAGPCPWR